MDTNPDEYQYVAPAYRRSIHPVPTTAKVFLYEVSQLRSDSSDDTDSPGREMQFRHDLQHFLQLEQPISQSMLWFKPGRNRTTEFMLEIKKRQIDICTDEYLPLRTVLLETAYNASQLIRRFFMQHADVTVSSPDYFEQHIMTSWERDPCVQRRQRQKQQQLQQRPQQKLQ